MRMVPYFSKVTSKAGDKKAIASKVRTKTISRIELYMQPNLVKCDGRMKDFFSFSKKYKISKNVCSHAIFLRKLLKGVLYKNEGISQNQEILIKSRFNPESR